MIRLYERLRGGTTWYPLGESHAKILVDAGPKPEDTWTRLLAGGVVLVAGGRYELTRELTDAEADDIRRQIALWSPAERERCLPGWADTERPTRQDRPEQRQRRLF